MQLMQVYSQKSIRTTLPRRPATGKDGELIHARGGAFGMAVSGIEEGVPSPPMRPAPGPAIAGETTWPPGRAKSSSADGNSGALKCTTVSEVPCGGPAVRQGALTEAASKLRPRFLSSKPFKSASLLV